MEGSGASRDRWRIPLLGYLSGACLVTVTIWQSFVLRGVLAQGDPGVAFRGDGVLDGFCRFDCGWYYGVARSGYAYSPGMQSNVAFFPAYPLAMRGVERLVGDYVNAGMLITFACGLGAAVLLWRWLEIRGVARTAALCALGLSLLFPYGWFQYGVVYSDSLFVVAVLGAFVLLERGHPGWAGVVGIIATADRPTGVALVAGLAVLALERRRTLAVPEGVGRLSSWRVPVRFDRSRWRWADLAVLVSAAGIGAFMWFLWRRWDDPLLFASVQKYWFQGSGPRTWFKVDFFSGIRSMDAPTYVATTVAQAGLALVVLISVPFVGRRFGWGYATFLFVLVMMPLVGSKDFQGTGRYLMGTFPLFALGGEWLADRERWVRVAGLAASAMILVVLAAEFSHGVYLS